MATLRELTGETDRMTVTEMQEMADHIGSLLQWPFFREAYKGLGLDIVRSILRSAAADRADREARIAADEHQGYNDRINGFYDKWYRYNRTDEGAAYDRGCAKAVSTGLCPEEFTLIEANQLVQSND